MDQSGLLLRKLMNDGEFEAFRRGFSRATGLPVRLLAVDGMDAGHESGRLGSELCGLIAGASGGCALCGALRSRLAEEARRSEGGRGECPAGLQEALLPLRVGGRVAGFLQTGQVRTRPPTEAGFRRLCRWLVRHGVDTDAVALRRAYFDSPQVGGAEYRAMLGLFELGLGAVLEKVRKRLEPAQRQLSPPVRRAVDFLSKNAHEPLTLNEVARVAGLSRHHFCTVFRRETGHTLTEHLTLLRVERAAERLAQPGARVSEIALGVGFQSLSQFNRSFRKVMGRAPTAWRNADRVAPN